MSIYYVHAVHYNWEHTHIEALQVILSGSSQNEEFSRQRVVNDIMYSLNEYYTFYPNSNSDYQVGARVILDYVNGVYYLKTVADYTTADNLSSLREY